jgi:hypothetical protein
MTLEANNDAIKTSDEEMAPLINSSDLASSNTISISIDAGSSSNQTRSETTTYSVQSAALHAIESQQYKSLMIKEILRGIIGGNELKRCHFYNIERIFGLEAQSGLLVITPHFMHVISGFRFIHTSSSPSAGSGAGNKSFVEMSFDFIPNIVSSNGKVVASSPATDTSAAPTLTEDKYSQLNIIHNESILAYNSSSYTAYNSTYSDLLRAQNESHTCAVLNMHAYEQDWLQELWIEMLESETFYDKIKIEEVSPATVLCWCRGC